MVEGISCVIVTYNEDRHLKACLESLSFCREVVLCDLGSTDSTLMIAQGVANVRIVTHALVSVVEKLWPTLFPMARMSWVLRMDPDEIFPSEIADGLVKFLQSTPNAGEVSLYYQYYFKGKPLRGTRWGGRRPIGKLYNRDAVILTGSVHRGVELKPGYAAFVFEAGADYSVKHYWVDSYRELFVKHRRYLALEGESRYASGLRFSWRRFILEILRNCKSNLLSHYFLADGCAGVFLRFFYIWYDAMAEISLKTYQRQRMK